MKPDPVFEAPWHAQVFALTVHLNETGYISWTEWTTRFGETLAAHGIDRELDGGDDYFAAWLETLEALLTDRGLAEWQVLSTIKAAWESAYLSTPHGSPVTLGKLPTQGR